MAIPLMEVPRPLVVPLMEVPRPLAAPQIKVLLPLAAVMKVPQPLAALLMKVLQPLATPLMEIPLPFCSPDDFRTHLVMCFIDVDYTYVHAHCSAMIGGCVLLILATYSFTRVSKQLASCLRKPSTLEYIMLHRICFTFK